MFLKIVESMNETFEIVGFGFLRGGKTNDKIAFDHINVAMVLDTHHKPALHSVGLFGQLFGCADGCLSVL